MKKTQGDFRTRCKNSNSHNSNDYKTVSRRIFLTLLSVVLATSMFLIAGCKPKPAVVNPATSSNPWPSTLNLSEASYGPYNAKDGTWAIYWYICGSDIELREDLIYSATGQIQEMLQVTLPDNVTVVIQAGGAKQWHLEMIDPTVINRLVYRGNTLSVAETQPLASMGDPYTLADFLNYCNLNYPAEHQALIIYDHGGGSLMGMANDNLFGDESLQLPHIGEVMRARPAASGMYELVGQCACLMSTIDSVAVFNGTANYLVGSEEMELGCTWDYTKVFAAIANDPNINGAKLGQVIADGYYEACEALGYTMYTTTSVIDMTYADELLTAYNALGNELLQGAVDGGQEYYAAFGRAAFESENYGALEGPISSFEMVDLGDLLVHASDLVPNSSAAMLRAIDNSMAYHRKNPLRAEGHGISCYFPYVGGERSFELFSRLTTSPSIYYFYEYAYYGSLSPAAQEYLASLSASPETPPERLPRSSELGLDDIGISPHGNGVYWLELGELADSVSEVFVMVGIYDETNEDFVLFGTHNDIYRDWELGFFYDVFNGTWGTIDGALCYMDPVSRGDNFVLYRVPVYHNGVPKLMMVLYSWTENYYYDGRYEIQGLITPKTVEVDAPNPAYEPLKIGDVIEPALFRYTAESDYDIILEDPGDSMTHAITVTGSTSFYDVILNDGLYPICFWMVDYSGESHYSEYGFYLIEDGIVDFYYDPVFRNM